jgi:hypothetical protein
VLGPWSAHLPEDLTSEFRGEHHIFGICITQLVYSVFSFMQVCLLNHTSGWLSLSAFGYAGVIYLAVLIWWAAGVFISPKSQTSVTQFYGKDNSRMFKSSDSQMKSV